MSVLCCSENMHFLARQLIDLVPHLYLWCAGFFPSVGPAELQEEALTIPLRCAPSVLREVQLGFGGFVAHRYSESGFPAPGDGSKVVQLSHHGNAHTGRRPLDCVQCGHEVAAALHELGVGTGGE